MTKDVDYDGMVRKVLGFLASIERDNAGYSWQTGPQISEALDMLPVDVNDAIVLANNRGWVKWLKWMGTAPYSFGHVMIIPEGRLWLENTRD